MSEVTKQHGRRWTADDDYVLLEMAERKASIDEISERIGRSPFSVEYRAGIIGLSVTRKREIYHPREQGDTAKQNSLVKANIMHLVDLKRAGHSPRFTEFKITSDDMIPNRSISPQPAFSPSSCALVW